MPAAPHVAEVGSDQDPAATQRRFVADTSIFVGIEQHRLARFPLDEPIATTVVTVAELTLGVLNAPDTASRSIRLRTLTVAQGLDCLCIDTMVADHWAEIVARSGSRGRRARVNDCWIAAIARANNAAVLTQDPDFSDLGVEVVTL
jgi:predicted nucleic acid-binding protein